MLRAEYNITNIAVQLAHCNITFFGSACSWITPDNFLDNENDRLRFPLKLGLDSEYDPNSPI